MERELNQLKLEILMILKRVDELIDLAEKSREGQEKPLEKLGIKPNPFQVGTINYHRHELGLEPLQNYYDIESR